MIIVIEGLDSSGKTTQAELLKKHYLEKGFSVESFHFPDQSSVFGKELYKYFNGEISYPREVVELLHTADKMNMQDYLSQFKNSDKVLILDRYILSQYAYAIASGLDNKWVDNLMSMYVEPDIKIYIDISPEISMSRKDNLDKYESDLDFLTDVYWCYHLGSISHRYHFIDGRKPIDEVFNDILLCI